MKTALLLLMAALVCGCGDHNMNQPAFAYRSDGTTITANSTATGYNAADLAEPEELNGWKPAIVGSLFSWDDAAVSDLPAMRINYAVAGYNGYLYVIGGRLSDLSITPSVIRLDLSAPAGSWDDAGVTDLPQGREWVTAIVYNGYLYVIGGVLSGGTSTASVIRLDLSDPAGSWDDAGVTDLPAGLRYHAAAINGSYLYVVGGRTGTSTPTASVIRLNLSSPTGSWDDAGVTDLPAAREQAAAAVYNNYLYIFGGNSTASVIRLNLSSPTGAWDDAGVTDLPASGAVMGSALNGSQIFLLSGKCRSLDLASPTGSWQTEWPALPVPAGTGYGAALYDGYIYAVGGEITVSKAVRMIAASNPFVRLDVTVPIGTIPSSASCALCLTGKNFSGMNVQIYSSNSGDFSTDSLSVTSAMLADAETACIPFTGVAPEATYWRIYLSDYNSSMQLNHIALSTLALLPFMEDGPSLTGLTATATDLISQGGMYLGTVQTSAMRKMSLPFGQVDDAEKVVFDAWAEACVKVRLPFFLIPDTNASATVYFGWTDSGYRYDPVNKNGLYTIGKIPFNCRA